VLVLTSIAVAAAAAAALAMPTLGLSLCVLGFQQSQLALRSFVHSGKFLMP
jgi:hypothetical protein